MLKIFHDFCRKHPKLHRSKSWNHFSVRLQHQTLQCCATYIQMLNHVWDDAMLYWQDVYESRPSFEAWSRISRISTFNLYTTICSVSLQIKWLPSTTFMQPQEEVVKAPASIFVRGTVNKSWFKTYILTIRAQDVNYLLTYRLTGTLVGNKNSSLLCSSHRNLK